MTAITTTKMDTIIKQITNLSPNMWSSNDDTLINFYEKVIIESLPTPGLHYCHRWEENCSSCRKPSFCWTKIENGGYICSICKDELSRPITSKFTIEELLETYGNNTIINEIICQNML